MTGKISGPGAVPSGSVIAFAGAAEPTGYLFCFGQAVSRTVYARLFAAIGVVWGDGDGATTFNLPDLRGRALFGRDDMGGAAANRITNAVSGIVGTTLGAVGGSQSMQAHVHAGGSGGTAGVGVDIAAAAGNTGSTGAGASENMPPAAIVNYVIKT